FWASSPAASITDGLDVFVQLVMAAMTTEPWCSGGSGAGSAGAWAVGKDSSVFTASAETTSATTGSGLLLLLAVPSRVGRAVENDFATWVNGTRSCGRRGPARLGTTVARSSCSVSEYAASGVSLVWNNPCSLA